MIKSILSRLLVLSLGLWMLNTAQAVLIVGTGAGHQHDHATSDQGKVYVYDDQTDHWSLIGDPNNPNDDLYSTGHSHVYALCEYEGELYAATNGDNVYRWVAENLLWKVTGANGSINSSSVEVRSLIVFNNTLYCGVCPTSNSTSIQDCLYWYDSNADKWNFVSPTTKFKNKNLTNATMRHGIVSMYNWGGNLYLGDLYLDSIVRWNPNDSNSLQEEMFRDGSCVWDFQAFKFSSDSDERLWCISQSGRIYARPFNDFKELCVLVPWW